MHTIEKKYIMKANLENRGKGEPQMQYEQVKEIHELDGATVTTIIRRSPITGWIGEIDTKIEKGSIIDAYHEEFPEIESRVKNVDGINYTITYHKFSGTYEITTAELHKRFMQDREYPVLEWILDKKEQQRILED